MNSYKETIATWNEIANLYQDKFMDLDIYDTTYQSFCILLPKEKPSILELGCGPGNVTKKIIQFAPNSTILATDISENMLQLTKKNNPSVRTKKLDIRNLATINKRFDGIIAGFVLPYVLKNDRLDVFKSLVDKLYDDGVLYLSFEARINEDLIFKRNESDKGMHFQYHNKYTVLEELLKLDLQLISEFKIPYHQNDSGEIHTVYILKKKKHLS